MSDGTFIIIVVISWVLAVVVGVNIGKSKGRQSEGLVLSLLLGWIGVVIIAVMGESDERRRENERRAARLREETAARVVARMAPPPAIVPVSTSMPGLPSRPAMIAEALERDPSLADTSVPDAAERLAKALAVVEAEHQMKLDLETARQFQAAKDSLANGDLATLTQIQAEAARIAKTQVAWHKCECGNEFKATVNKTCPRCGSAMEPTSV